MLGLIEPHLELNSVLELNLRHIAGLKLRTLLLDVDCTLKDYEADSFSPSITAWLSSLQAGGIQLCLLSNGKRRRIAPLAQRYGLACVSKAFKPLPFGCWKAIRQLRADARQTAVIGDQLFADVIAGRMAGLFTILVRPTTTVEPWFTRLKRPLERRMLVAMRSRNAIANLQSSMSNASQKACSSANRCEPNITSMGSDSNSTWETI
jgi:HAD superfamily phosphatase (TIGR01668 family)